MCVQRTGNLALGFSPASEQSRLLGSCLKPATKGPQGRREANFPCSLCRGSSLRRGPQFWARGTALWGPGAAGAESWAQTQGLCLRLIVDVTRARRSCLSLFTEEMHEIQSAGFLTCLLGAWVRVLGVTDVVRETCADLGRICRSG